MYFDKNRKLRDLPGTPENEIKFREFIQSHATGSPISKENMDYLINHFKEFIKEVGMLSATDCHDITTDFLFKN